MSREVLAKLIDAIPSSVTRDIERQLHEHIDKCGLYYRIFSRVKSSRSLIDKLEIKQYSGNKKLQDLLGLRITLYFADDIPLCENIISSIFNIVDVSRDEQSIDVFRPTRLNYICKIPSQSNLIDDYLYQNYPIDDTFELQIRTVFSEGWHEVEHDMRYKCKSDWEGSDDLSRMLNGIYANLTTCDWSINALFDTLTYRHYKNRSWAQMLKSKLRIRLSNPTIPPNIIDIFNEDPLVAKEFIRFDRDDVLLNLSKSNFSMPLTLANMLFYINEIGNLNTVISSQCPLHIRNMAEAFIAR